MAIPPVPASISIPPAASLALNLIAAASASVDVILTEEPVAVSYTHLTLPTMELV